MFDDQDDIDREAYLNMLERCEQARAEIIEILPKDKAQVIDDAVNILNKPQFWLANKHKESSDFIEFADSILNAKNQGLSITRLSSDLDSLSYNSPFYKEEHDRLTRFITLLEKWELYVSVG